MRYTNVIFLLMTDCFLFSITILTLADSFTLTFNQLFLLIYEPLPFGCFSFIVEPAGDAHVSFQPIVLCSRQIVFRPLVREEMRDFAPVDDEDHEREEVKVDRDVERPDDLRGVVQHRVVVHLDAILAFTSLLQLRHRRPVFPLLAGLQAGFLKLLIHLLWQTRLCQLGFTLIVIN